MPQTAKSRNKYALRHESDYTEVATLLCGYVKKVCWILRSNFHWSAYILMHFDKTVLSDGLLLQKYLGMVGLVHVKKDEGMSMQTCHLYCFMPIQDTG